MGVENRAVVLAEFVGYGVAIALDLFAGGLEGALKSLQLRIDRVARQKSPRDTESLVVHHQGFANGDTGRNGNSLQFLHRRPYMSARAPSAPQAARDRELRGHASTP